MQANAARNWRARVGGLAVVCLFVTLAPSLVAQTDGTGALTGTVIGPSGGPVAFAMVTATSADTGQVRPGATGTDGTYKFNLPPGNYTMRLECRGYKTVEIPAPTINENQTVVLDRKLEADAQTNSNTATPPQNQTTAPPNNPTAPSLEDLGITPDQAKGNPQAQALLDRRSHMLKVHQRLGLITIAPFAATLISSGFAGEGRPAAPTVTCMSRWVGRRWDCISRLRTLLFAPPRYPAPRLAGPSACTRRWPGFMVRGWF